MAIAASTAIGLGIAAVSAGVGVAGAVKGSSKGETSSKSDVSTVDAGQATAAENAAGAGINTGFSQFSDLVQAGPGASDVTAGVGASRDLADLLKQYQQTGGAPSQQDQSQANTFAGQMFAGQRLGAQQAAIEANQTYAQQAAIQGRGGLDPIFRNKVAQQQQQSEQMIGAQQGAFAAQQSQQFSQNRLDFAGKRASVLGGLATQALSNRQALVGMGSQIQSAERQFRLATATRTGTGQGAGTTVTPGSALNGLSAGLAGLGTMAGMYKSLPSETPGQDGNAATASQTSGQDMMDAMASRSGQNA